MSSLFDKINNAINHNDYLTFTKLKDDSDFLKVFMDNNIFEKLILKRNKVFYIEFLDMIDLNILPDNTKNLLFRDFFAQDYKINYDKIHRYRFLNIDDNNVPKYYNEGLNEEMREIFFNDDIEMFKLLYPTTKFDYFIYACEYKAKNIINFLIDKRLGINYKTDNRYSGFTYLCFYNMKDEINRLINILPKSFLTSKDIKGNPPFFYTKINSVIENILNMESDLNNYKLDFRVYNYDEFEIVKYLEIPTGGYGKAIHVIHKDTGINMIIKEFSDCSEFFIDRSSILEFTFLKFINSINPQTAVHCYGISINNNCICMVLEYLDRTLEDHLKLINRFEQSSKIIFFKDIIHQLIIIIDSLNSMGISHDDTKEINVMVDNDNRLRLIDFGLSNYLGFMPSLNFTNNLLITEYIKPSETTGPSFNPARTLNVDIYSIAVIICNFVFGTKYNRYSLYNGKIFYQEYANNNISDRFVQISDKVINSLNNLYPNLYDLLIKILDSDNNIRYYPKEILKHKFFDQNSNFINNDRITKIFRTKPNFKNYIPYTYDLDRELMYKNEMFEAIRFIQIKGRNLNKNNINILLHKIENYRNIFKYWNFNFSAFLNLFIFNDLELYFQLAPFILIFHASYEKEFSYKMKDLWSINKIKELINNDEIFSFLPFGSHIGYLIIKIQEYADSLYSEDYINLVSKICTVIIAFILETDLTIIIWDLIINTYRIFQKKNNKFPLLDDLENIDIIDNFEDIYIKSNSYVNIVSKFI